MEWLPFRAARSQEGKIIMTECQSLLRHKDHSSADQRMFDLWLRANAVIGSIFGLAIMAMAIGGARGPELPQLREARAPISSQQSALHSASASQSEVSAREGGSKDKCKLHFATSHAGDTFTATC